MDHTLSITRKKKELKPASGARLIFGYLGLFLIFEGVLTLIPAAIIAIFREEWMVWMDFAIPGLGGVLLGAILFLALIAGRPKARFKKHEDVLLLVLLWISAMVLGAIPFYLTNFPILNFAEAEAWKGLSPSLGMSFTECLYESFSGYCAVGFTVSPESLFITEVNTITYPATHVFLFHRSLTQLIGGVGLVLVVAGAISDRYNLKLYFAEGHNDKLMPNLGKSAKLIFGIYVGYIILGTVSLWLAGMTWFDALCHSISALATGGFSTRYNSIAFYSNNAAYPGNGVFPCNAIGIEIICMVLMILGATNFVLHTFLFRGRIKKFFTDVEIKLTGVLLVVTIALGTLGTLYLYDGGKGLDFWTALRYASFGTISSMTTTGFTNYPSLLQLGYVMVAISMLVMTIGGGVGSTAGGIKQFRVALLAKSFVHSSRSHDASPHLVIPNPINRLGVKANITESQNKEAQNFAILYLTFAFVGGLALCFCPGNDFVSGMYMFSSCLSGTGMGISDVYFGDLKSFSNPSYVASLWIMMLSMFAGRLEIMPLYYAVRRVTWDLVEESKENRRKFLYFKMHNKAKRAKKDVIEENHDAN
ncbi:MAG: hypothetical protein K5694_00150 [Bacilli bacterium]|nr:hypothetical protein [Bacilli bacterium]